MTLQVVLAADAGSFAVAARQWQAMAEDLDNAAEDLIRGTRGLEDVWALGPASQAAHERAARLRAEVSNAYNPCRWISQALREHAEALSGLQQTAKSIIGEATSSGFSVDTAAGTVSAPPSMYQASSPHTVAQRVNSYVHQLTGIVDQAVGWDERTTNVITMNLPDAKVGFGSLSAPPVSMSTLEAQRTRPAAEVKVWWCGLTPQQQEQAIADFPELVGWLDGVPASDRDTANRSWLQQRQEQLQATEDLLAPRIAELQRQNPGQDYGKMVELSGLLDQREAIDAEQGKLAGVSAALSRLGDKGVLLGVDPAGDGKAIIAVGDPDTARHTAVWVPGLGTTLNEGRTVADVERVANLQQEAEAQEGRPGTVSTVMWLGYDAPELTTVGGEQRSRDGAGPYAKFMDGLRVTHDGGPQHLTAMGHSYGSTVVGEAALHHGMRVDDIVTAGSPGTHADNAKELMRDPRHVWAGSAHDDLVSRPEIVRNAVQPMAGIGPIIGNAYVDGHGVSPHESDFGANRYVVDTSGHSSYWSPGSQSLANQAAIVVGQYSVAGLEHGKAPPDLP